MVNNQKYVNALFLFAALIFWFVTKHYVEVLVGYFQLARTLGGATDALIHGLPILLGVSTFVILRFNSASYNFVSDAVGEIVKVNWPTPKDVRLGTVVVIVTVILAGVFFGAVDLFYTTLIKTILGT